MLCLADFLGSGALGSASFGFALLNFFGLGVGSAGAGSALLGFGKGEDFLGAGLGDLGPEVSTVAALPRGLATRALDELDLGATGEEEGMASEGGLG